MKHRLSVLLMLVFFAVFSLQATNNSLIFSEVQPSNATSYADEEGKHEDWIELKNTSSSSISLEGWSITDNVLQPKKWTMTGGTLAAGAYLVVFASDKDRRTPGSVLHTNFKLSATGDYLALYDPAGVKVMELNQMPRVEQDFSYCYMDGYWIDCSVPTPGAANTLDGIFRNPDPVFSMNHGLFTTAFDLTINAGLPKTKIYYTLDGSVPSPTNGTLYSQPLAITGTRIVRAITVSDDSWEIPLADSRITTKSYLFPDDILQQSNTPAGYPAKWGPYSSLPDSAIADYEMDPEIVNNAEYAEKIKQSFNDLPIVSLVTDKENFFSKDYDPVTGGIYIYTSEQLSWERPVSLEYINMADGSNLQVDCGVQLHGGASRLPEKNPKHSFRLNFRDDYGVGKLRYPIIGADGPREINSFFLRAGFSDTWNHWSTSEQSHATYVRETWTKLTQLRMNNEGSHLTYAHLFVNGMYWGLYNPIERIDDDFCAYWFGGSKDDWDVIKDAALLNGSSKAWNSLKDSVYKISASDLTYSTELYMKIQGLNIDGTPNPSYSPLIDMDNYIDYMMVNYHGSNTDWDNKNWAAARNRENPGLGYRFFCWDSENVIDSPTDNLMTSNTGTRTGPLTMMFQKLRTVPLFCIRFGDRAQKHLFNDGWLSATKAAQTFVDLTSLVEEPLYAESARWGDYRRDVHPWSSKGVLYTPDNQFVKERDALLTNYFPYRTGNFVGMLTALSPSLYPSVSATSYAINSMPIESDTIEKGDILSISGTGLLYYTLDNTDPVNWAVDGTGVAKSTAVLYSSAVSLLQNTTVKSRALSQGKWSALNEKSLIVRNLVGLKDPFANELQLTASNFPNPFRGSTTFNYVLPYAAKVNMSLYDVSGRVVTVVVNEEQSAGSHELMFDGAVLKPGVYLCRIVLSGTKSQTKVIRIVKL
jgi:hypothetical protein